MPLATRYDVSTQVISSTLAENAPCMCGSATFTMLVSRTSRIVPSITETATSHFCARRSGMKPRTIPAASSRRTPRVRSPAPGPDALGENDPGAREVADPPLGERERRARPRPLEVDDQRSDHRAHEDDRRGWWEAGGYDGREGAQRIAPTRGLLERRHAREHPRDRCGGGERERPRLEHDDPGGEPDRHAEQRRGAGRPAGGDGEQGGERAAIGGREQPGVREHRAPGGDERDARAEGEERPPRRYAQPPHDGPAEQRHGAGRGE